MNYSNLYRTIISEFGTNVKHKSYCERHHIVPRSVGGEDSFENLVYVSARVHFILHRILLRLYDDPKLKFAFWAMCNQLHGDVSRNYRVTSRTYDTAKRGFAQANSILHKGKTLSESHIDSIRRYMISNNIHKGGPESHLYGVARSNNVRNKISETKLASPEKNASYKGDYVTPKGRFKSAPQAAMMTGYPVDIIRSYCKSPDRVVTSRMVKLSSVLSADTTGMRLRDLGWDFLPKSTQSHQPDLPHQAS